MANNPDEDRSVGRLAEPMAPRSTLSLGVACDAPAQAEPTPDEAGDPTEEAVLAETIKHYLCRFNHSNGTVRIKIHGTCFAGSPIRLPKKKTGPCKH